MSCITVAPDKTLWAAGSNGTLAHYADGTWKTLSNPSSNVDGSGAIAAPTLDDVWAVDEGQQYHLDGAGWEALPFDQLSTTESVATLPDGEAWAIGSPPVDINHPPVYNDPTAPQLFHGKNGIWTAIAHTSKNDLGDIVTTHILVVSANDEWLYTYAAIWHGQDDIWTRELGVP